MISKEQVKNFLTVHKEKIDFGFFLARGLKEFQTNKSIFSLIESGFNFVQKNLVNDHKYTYDYLIEKNGWFRLLSEIENFPVELFKSSLNQFENYKINVNKDFIITVYKLPCGEIVYVPGNGYLDPDFFYNKNLCNANKIVEILVEMKHQQMKSNFISLECQQGSWGIPKKYEFISHYHIDKISNKSITFINRLKKLNDRCRSILLYGPPGTGKSTLIKDIVNALGYKSLLLSFDNFDANKISFIIKVFKFEAIIIDDFDGTNANPKILKFLEDIRPYLKLVLASANSLKNIHPALERPGRFDEKVLIDSLDEDSVKDILKDLSKEYFEKVKSWPVAYLNEFVLRAENYPKEELNDSFIELDKRVKDQIEKLKV